jgi:hypothetical protein
MVKCSGVLLVSGELPCGFFFWEYMKGQFKIFIIKIVFTYNLPSEWIIIGIFFECILLTRIKYIVAIIEFYHQSKPMYLFLRHIFLLYNIAIN